MSSYHQEIANVTEKVRTFFEKTFASVTLDGPVLDTTTLSAQPLMLVSTHRSHVDYFLVGNNFHRLGCKNLRFAAGDNLTSLPVIGPKFKAFGAFAIERDTGFDRNYVKNLCYNVVSMLEKGDTILVFPEAGRSYSGAMLEMRIGVLGASILSQAKTPDRDVNYIPIAASYEDPPDVPWYAMQQKGKKWRKHSNPLPQRILGNLLYYGADACSFIPFFVARFFGRNYGNVYIDYGSPVSVRSVVDIAKLKTENARDEFSAHREAMLKLGEVVHAQLTRLYRILPMHVVASQIKQHGARTIDELISAFPAVIAELKEQGRNVKLLESNSAKENTVAAIRQLRRIKAISFKKNECSIKKQSLIDYAAKTIG